ncbi:RNA-binding protein [bacterium]|nr:RNA-binding protein [bacterium]
MKIYVGNLAYGTTEADLRQAFEAFGQVESATIITDRETGRSKGFGFVEMTEGAEATAAINALNGQDFQGRTLRVNEARPKTESRGGGGFRDRSRPRPY